MNSQALLTAEPAICDVSIVIVNWNTRDYLRNCIKSIIVECTDYSYEIIVVDNASNDNSCEMLKAEFPSVQVIANSTNNGFAGANNQGIRIAKGRYVLLLNPDTIILDNAIDKCIAFADERPEIGIVGCQVLEDEVRIQNTCFLFPSPITILLTQLGFTSKFAKSRWLGCSEMGWWDRKDEREVEVVTGMFMFSRQSAIEKVGLMDEDYFMYAEEADWCYRFWKAGYKCVFTPIARIIHVDGGAKSTAQIRHRMFVQKQKSLLLFQEKNRGIISWTMTWLIFVVAQLIRIPVIASLSIFSKRENRISDIRIALAASAVKYHLLRIEPMVKDLIAIKSPSTLPANCNLQWQIVTDFKCLEVVHHEWNLLLEQIGGFGFSSYEYCQVWWNHYSDSRQLKVFIFHKNSKLVGIVPLFIEQIKIGPLSIKVAKLLASDHVYSLCSPPILPKHAKEIISIVANEIINQCNCKVLCFSPLCEVDELSRISIRAIKNTLPTEHVIENHDLKVQTFFRIPDSYDQYIKSLSKNARYNYRRYWKQLCDKFHIEEEICKDCYSVMAGFEEFWRMHTAQWKCKGRPGHFGDWPGSLEFHRELIASQAEIGNCRLYQIIADGQIISSQYGFRFGEHLHSLLPARLIGPKWDRFGIGTIGFERMIKAAIEEGIRTIEEGPAHYAHKLTLGATECKSQSIMITATGAIARWRVSMFKCMATLLDKLYYRIYFSRIVPLLPWKSKPLWSLWIRSRL